MRHRVFKRGLGAAPFLLVLLLAGSVLFVATVGAVSPAWALTRISRPFEIRRPRIRQ